jgi:hypothetical protein
MTAGVAMSVTRSPGPRWWTALAAALIGCTSPPDPCGDAQTCVTIDVDSFLIRTIDQLELDLVYGNVHTTTTTGTRGTSIDLPVSTALILDLPGPLIEVTFIAAARLDGAVLGADAGQITVQSGHRSSTSIDLSPFGTCVESAIYCGGVGVFTAEFETLYQCDHGVPLYYARCPSGCGPIAGPGGVCYGTGGLCRDAGNYCGGHTVDGDPFTLYVCQDFRGTQPRACPNGCLVRGDGDDVCK